MADTKKQGVTQDSLGASRGSAAVCKRITRFPYNPAHPIGTCAHCGCEMVYNVPRLGPNGGCVHKATGRFSCDDKPGHVEGFYYAAGYNDALRASGEDTKRLDWLEATKCEIVIGEDWPALRKNFKTIREAIDAAMKKTD